MPRPRILSGVGPGWWPIVEGLHEQIIKLDPDYTIDQVKEKFGGLRYYYTLSWWGAVKRTNEEEATYKINSRIVEALVDLAERIASRTCEDCGRPGKTRYEGWALTQCEECRAKSQVNSSYHVDTKWEAHDAEKDR